ncbi:MAG: type II secretion system F family protein [archaeon]
MSLYRIISMLYPKRIMSNYKELLDYANLGINPYRFTGFVLSFGFVFAWMAAFGLGAMFRFNLWFTFAVAFIAFEVTVYVWLLLSVDAKARVIERALPDALQLMSSNLRAGLTPEKALLLAARPEFGPLTDEITRVGKDVMIGKDVSVAMMDMTKRVKSDKLRKTIELIVSGLRAGGELAALIEQTARNLRDQEFVDQKIRSNIRMYVIFIFSAVSFGAPLLYGLSSFLVDVMQDIISKVEIPEESVGTMSMPLTISQVSISSEFIMTYVITSLIMTAVMGSLILGLISKGEEKQGFKLVPIMIAVSLLIFFAVRFLVSALLGGLLMNL